MELQRAGDLARELMQAHGLTDWKFTVDFAKRRFGQCRYSKKEISLSIPLTKLNSEEKVRDTILHEIAHALAGPRTGHGRIWKQKAAAIGANPKRCYGDEVIAPPKAFKGTCPAGHTTERDRIRKGLACGKCCGGKYDPAHKFVWTRN